MNEREWLTCNDPQDMVWFLEGRVSDRKLRLFGCACCRRIWRLLTDERSRQAVELAELSVDGRVTKKERETRYLAAFAALEAWGKKKEKGAAAKRSASQAAMSVLTPDGGLHAAREACVCTLHAVVPPEKSRRAELYSHPVGAAEWKSQSDILRCIAGNPFRPAPICRTPAVLALAQAVYDHRILPAGTLDPDRLAVLADALEESGCTDADILGHLRGPGPHVRGCFVLDTLLDKS